MAGNSYPSFEDHRRAWEGLARGIAALRNVARELPDGAVAPSSRPGELTIIGSGIETLGFSLGDQALIERADKVLFCVADPATIVWIRRIRPDALDLYVLYDEGKSRYTTYMQMAEAQLYWVRQGLSVVVIFYGHPGIFVLSTHRAIKIARREGHRAVMKAGVSALDTLCADLGVDPSHPGLQTHEATDFLTRRRRLDTSLHVILWQVGLIGELGYRRQGYLNTNFSYFVAWLQETYGADYRITHYVGSRYPTIDPLIETFSLSALHDPAIQAGITGLSTFYIPPRDVVPTDRRTALDLKILRDGQRLVTPPSPLREIGRYGRREREAFRAFARFDIPPSYRWQDDTAASDFLIALRFDPELQALYRRDPQQALADSRFDGLSDKERALLATRDAGAIQIAAKGGFQRSLANERLITDLLSSRPLAATLMARLAGAPRAERRLAAAEWLAEEGIVLDQALLHGSVDFVYRNTLFPWTGVFMTESARRIVVLIGNRVSRARSVLFVDGHQIGAFRFENGVIGWRAGRDVPFDGVLKLDLGPSGRRQLVGRTWTASDGPGGAPTFVADEVDPGRAAVGPLLAAFRSSGDRRRLTGDYAVRSNGRFAREVMPLTIGQNCVSMAGAVLPSARIEGDSLSWSGGVKDWHAGRMTFVPDPIAGSIELFGHCRSADEAQGVKCHGARRLSGPPVYAGPRLPDWAETQLSRIAASRIDRGGLLLWHKWEKASFTNFVLNTHLVPMV